MDEIRLTPEGEAGITAAKERISAALRDAMTGLEPLRGSSISRHFAQAAQQIVQSSLPEGWTCKAAKVTDTSVDLYIIPPLDEVEAKITLGPGEPLPVEELVERRRQIYDGEAQPVVTLVEPESEEER